MVYAHEREPLDRGLTDSRLHRYRACGRFHGMQMSAMCLPSLVAVLPCIIEYVSKNRSHDGNRGQSRVGCMRSSLEAGNPACKSCGVHAML